MDLFTSTESRLFCAALTAAIAAMVLMNPRAARVRLVLGLLIALGIANAFLLIHKRDVHSNLTHYFLGAKYRIPYFDFYKVTAAAMGHPQALYRDLREPDRLFRADPREQRLYTLGLLRQGNVAFPESATLDELAEACRSAGLVEREAQEILDRAMEPGQAAALRNDLAKLKLDVDDFGFNGSPLYALIRQIDPTLHRPFGPAVCRVNLLWQWAALFAMALLAARAFRWTREDALLVVALIVASWDYTGWALNGLIAAGWMLPAMLALWGFHRRNPWLAGFGIAWAGLIKLFPFILLLPPAILLLRQLLARQVTPAGRDAAKTIAACALFGAALAAAGSLTGLSWLEFLRKIAVQFQDSSYLNNSAGISGVLLTLGLSRSLSIILPQITVFFALLWILWMHKEDDLRARLPSVSLLLLASMPWLTQTWLNYYAVIGLFLLPELLRNDRRAANVLLVLFSVGAFLPEFGFAYPQRFALLPIVKGLGYLLLPLAAIALEIGNIQRTPDLLRGRDPVSQGLFGRLYGILTAGVALSLIVLCVELYVTHSMRSNLAAGRDLYRKGAIREALPFFESAARHAPWNAAARIELGQTLADLRDIEGALAQYRIAVEQKPDSAPARSRLGVLLIQIGQKDEALAQFQEAARLMPYDETIQLNCGSALLSVGKKTEAAQHFRTALDINPNFLPAREQWERAAKSGPASAELLPLSRETMDIPR